MNSIKLKIKNEKEKESAITDQNTYHLKAFLCLHSEFLTATNESIKFQDPLNVVETLVSI